MEGKERQQIAGQPQSNHFEQIDPHRADQHEPAGNSPDRDDLNLEGAKRHPTRSPKIPTRPILVSRPSRPIPAWSRRADTRSRPAPRSTPGRAAGRKTSAE